MSWPVVGTSETVSVRLGRLCRRKLVKWKKRTSWKLSSRSSSSFTEPEQNDDLDADRNENDENVMNGDVAPPGRSSSKRSSHLMLYSDHLLGECWQSVGILSLLSNERLQQFLQCCVACQIVIVIDCSLMASFIFAYKTQNYNMRKFSNSKSMKEVRAKHGIWNLYVHPKLTRFVFVKLHPYRVKILKSRTRILG